MPRRLQACMQELLSANERHHALLNQQHDTDERLHKAEEEIERLTEALAAAEEDAKRARAESTREREAHLALREAYDLQAARPCGQARAASTHQAKVGWR